MLRIILCWVAVELMARYIKQQVLSWLVNVLNLMVVKLDMQK